jgi:hypothetical protein
MWWIYFVFIYGNRRMKPVEIILRRGKRENDRGCKYHNVSPYTMIIGN